MLFISLVILSYFLLSVLVYLALMIYYRNGINDDLNLKKEELIDTIFVSVLVCFRNEEAHLPALLKSIAAQNYKANHFEILLYNDASTDGSLSIIKNFEIQYPSINVTCIDVPHQPGCNSAKKLAINHASIHSKAAIMVITDADCILDANWLTKLVQTYCNKKAKLIAAPVAIIEKRNWIHQLQSWEMYALTAVTAGAIGHKKAIMCNGANMAFDRKVFLLLDPYKDNLHISSGDDMFLLLAMQQQHRNNIEFLAHSEATVNTHAKDSIKDYLNQRIRWASKSKNYHENYIKLVALIVLNMNVVLLLSPFTLCFFSLQNSLVLMAATLFFKQLSDYLCIKKYVNKMQLKPNFVPLFIFQYIEALLTFLVAIKSIKGSYTWKNRKQHF